jgi:hypothetical protein
VVWGVSPEMYREEVDWTFCMRGMKMGTAENEIGEGESVCLWDEGKIVFLLPDTVRAQCLHRTRYQTKPDENI